MSRAAIFTICLLLYPHGALCQDGVYPRIGSTEMQEMILSLLSRIERGETHLYFEDGPYGKEPSVLSDLNRAGYIEGLGYSAHGHKRGGEFSTSITLKGRDYLEELRSRRFWPTFWRVLGQFAFWTITIAASTIIAKTVERYLWLNGREMAEVKGASHVSG